MSNFDDVRQMTESFLDPVKEAMEHAKRMSTISDLVLKTSPLATFKPLEAQIDLPKHERWNTLLEEIQ